LTAPVLDDIRMSFRIVAALVLTTALTAGVSAAGQRRPVTGPRDPGRVPPAGSSSISGRVYDAATNAPIARAQVQALGDERIVDAITDDQGRYQLAGLGAGAWRVTIAKPGYFPWEVGQRRPFESPPPVTLGAQQRLVANVALSRGGVIAGRVSDDTGEPLAGLRVRVYRARMAGGYRRLETVGAADFTDDTGAYRIYGLPPGDYFVGASLRVAPSDSVVETTYAPTYYPGTGDLAGAQRIRLTLGTEATAVFPLLPVRNVRVSGAVATSAGAPANAFLTLTSEAAELGMPLGIGAVTREDGNFTLPDVPPGRYTLSASLRGEGASEHGAIALTVGSEDLSGLTVVTGKPAAMRVRIEPDADVSRDLPSTLEVKAVGTRAGEPFLSSGSGRAFALDDLVEPFHLRVSGLGEGWAVKAIVVNGVDVTDSAVTLATGQVADARIVLTDRVIFVGGTATASGKPAKAEVILFPENAAKWTYPSRYVRVAQTDDRGRFRLAGLPPGETYLAVATDYLEDGEQNDPEFLERMREAGVAFRLDEAGTPSLDLRVLER
jgi:hypothetical protein